MNQAFLAELDAQIAADRQASQARAPVEIVSPLNADTTRNDRPVAGEAGGMAVADWKGVLDNITAAKSVAQEMEKRLRLQDATQEALIADLKRAHQEIKAVKDLLREVQDQAEARECEMQSAAETRVRAIEAWAESQIREADDRTRAAAVRAEAAEGWLVQIEQASMSLLPDFHSASL